MLVKRPVCLCLNPLSITCMHIHVDKYFEHSQGYKFMNLRTYAHIYIKLQLLVIKNFCTIKIGFIYKYIALKQKFNLEYMYLLKSRKIKLHECSFPLTGVLSFFFFNLES